MKPGTAESSLGVGLKDSVFEPAVSASTITAAYGAYVTV